MAKKSKTVRVSEEELELLKKLRSGQLASGVEPAVTSAAKSEDAVRTSAQSELAAALAEAIRSTRDPAKKTIANRVRLTPWTPKDGSPKLKMKREFYHHGLLLRERVSNEEIELLNKVRPGYYCDGFIKVTLRKDRGIDIDYPVKTASQRLKLVNQFGIRTFAELLQRLVDEHANPKSYTRPEDLELFEETV